MVTLFIGYVGGGFKRIPDRSSVYTGPVRSGSVPVHSRVNVALVYDARPANVRAQSDNVATSKHPLQSRLRSWRHYSRESKVMAWRVNTTGGAARRLAGEWEKQL